MICQSQNKGENIFSKEGISKITIDGNQIFNIKVEAIETDEVKIFSLTDGEYQDDFRVFSELKEETLNIRLLRSPFYNKPDDKRNAHKVIAATLKILLPKNQNLSIISDVGSVNLEGHFNTLFVQLREGHFKLKGQAKSVTVNTIEGGIYIVTSEANIEAESSYGKVDIAEILTGKHHWKLKSIHGNITAVIQE